jgi:O-antigen/teichoic acid export membrane protein
MTRLHAVLRNTGYLALGEATKPMLSFLLVLVISRKLGRDGVGTYAIILTFSGLFELIATAGLGPLIVRGIAADRSKLSSYVNGSIGVSLVAAAVLMPVMLLALQDLNYPAPIERGIRLLTYTLLIAVLQQHTVSVCEGLQNMRLRAAISVMDTAGRLITGVFMIVEGHGILGVIQGIAITRIVTTAIGFLVLRRQTGLGVDSRVMVRMPLALIRASWPFLLMIISNTAFWSANTLMLSKLRPVDDVGVYNAAWRITEILKNVFYSYLIALLPMMSHSFVRSLDDFKRECNVSLKYLAILTVPLATGLSILAPRIIRLIYGPNFDAAIPVLQVLAWTVCLFSVTLVFARVLVASHNQVLDMYGNIAALAINVILGWLLIRSRGPLGAGIATLVSLAAFAGLEYGMVARRLFRPDVVAPLAQTAIASLVMAMALYWLDSFPLALVIVVGTAIYLVALACLGTFARAEVLAARELAGEWIDYLPLVVRRAASALVAEQ